jgi:hypothetical protein
MWHRFLSVTGLHVSELCLGALTFGRELDETESRAVLDHFVDAGRTLSIRPRPELKWQWLIQLKRWACTPSTGVVKWATWAPIYTQAV